jgi:hypothetical protein
LKERLFASSSQPNEFFWPTYFWFLACYTFITPTLIIYSVFDELLWSTNGDNIYV